MISFYYCWNEAFVAITRMMALTDFLKTIWCSFAESLFAVGPLSDCAEEEHATTSSKSSGIACSGLDAPRQLINFASCTYSIGLYRSERLTICLHDPPQPPHFVQLFTSFDWIAKAFWLVPSVRELRFKKVLPQHGSIRRKRLINTRFLDFKMKPCRKEKPQKMEMAKDKLIHQIGSKCTEREEKKDKDDQKSFFFF